ncbi:MAG: hypothetical protein PHY12_13240 [Eubacteriales bacterium]|nr:hypothetical protein [Eubacteriales bacterium]
MKQFRKWICAVLALCTMASFVPALAEAASYCSIAGLKAQTADGWHRTYEAHGRTIAVDIPVQVPDAEAFPALTAEAMPAASGLKATKAGYAVFEDGEYSNQDGYFLYQSPAAKAYMAAAKQSKPAGMPKGYAGYPLIRRLNELELDIPYASNNETTVRQSQALLEEGWQRFFPNETLELAPSWIYAYSSCRRFNGNANIYGDEEWPDFEGPLLAHFNQCMGGIPLLCFASESYQTFTAKAFKAEDALRAEITAISQSYRSVGLGMFCSLQYHALRQTSVLEEDVPLCSFDKVMETCEGLIADGKLRRVDTLRLGYAIWRQKSGSFVLMPTWVIEGELFKSADAAPVQPPRSYDSDPLEYGKIMINAQSGELIDPWNLAKDRIYDAPALTVWNDLQ